VARGVGEERATGGRGDDGGGDQQPAIPSVHKAMLLMCL